MSLVGISGAPGVPGGYAPIAQGVYVAAGLVFLLGYRQVLAAADAERRELSAGLDLTGLPLFVAFATIVAARAVVVAT